MCFGTSSTSSKPVEYGIFIPSCGTSVRSRVLTSAYASQDDANAAIERLSFETGLELAEKFSVVALAE